jgi:hypothetical protein
MELRLRDMMTRALLSVSCLVVFLTGCGGGTRPSPPPGEQGSRVDGSAVVSEPTAAHVAAPDCNGGGVCSDGGVPDMATCDFVDDKGTCVVFDWLLVAQNPTLRLDALWGSGPNDIWAIGVRDGAGFSPPSSLANWNGRTWSFLDPVAPSSLHAISGSARDNVWAVGDPGPAAGDPATIVRWDGHQWSSFASPVIATFRAVWVGGPNDVWIAEDEGGVLHWTGTWVSERVRSTRRLFGIWSDTHGDVWAVGEGVVLRRHAGVWSPAFNPSGSVYSVWSNETDLWVVGDSGTILRWNGSTWTSESIDGGNRLNAVWGSGSDVWAVGDNGTIVHRTTAGWTPERSDRTDDLFGVWASSPDDVWAVGGEGVILRRKPTRK